MCNLCGLSTSLLSDLEILESSDLRSVKFKCVLLLISGMWNEEQDLQLFQGESHDDLRENYGLQTLNRRLKFLTDYLKQTDL